MGARKRLEDMRHAVEARRRVALADLDELYPKRFGTMDGGELGRRIVEAVRAARRASKEGAGDLPERLSGADVDTVRSLQGGAEPGASASSAGGDQVPEPDSVDALMHELRRFREELPGWTDGLAGREASGESARGSVRASCTFSGKIIWVEIDTYFPRTARSCPGNARRQTYTNSGVLMTVASPRLFPPAHGVAVGQLAPLVRRPPWLLRLMSGLVIGLFVLVVVEALFLLFVARNATNIYIWLLLIILTILSGASTGDAYITGRPTDFVVRLRRDGIEGTAEKYSWVVPWSRIERLWLVHGGSGYPVLCVTMDDLSRFAPGGVRWRLKTYANQRLFGTPLATPLLNTGLSWPGVLDAVRRYLDESDSVAPARPTTTVEASVESRQSSAVHHRFRHQLLAGLMTLTILLTGVLWLAAFTGVRFAGIQEGAVLGWLDSVQQIMQAAAVLTAATAATLLVAATGTRLYRAIVPFGDVAKGFREPVLRVGPEGVEHVVRGRAARMPWDAVRRVYLAGDRSGGRVCVTTADPYALVPRVRGWSVTYTANSVYGVLRETDRVGAREIQLVAAQDVIADPPERFQAVRVDGGGPEPGR